LQEGTRSAERRTIRDRALIEHGDVLSEARLAFRRSTAALAGPDASSIGLTLIDGRMTKST
jgi:hypothetical protein